MQGQLTQQQLMNPTIDRVLPERLRNAFLLASIALITQAVWNSQQLELGHFRINRPVQSHRLSDGQLSAGFTFVFHVAEPQALVCASRFFCELYPKG